MIVDENTKIYVGDTKIKKVYQGNTDISPLPYTELEYIESTGAQYINTNFVANGGMVVEYAVSYSNRNCMGYIVGSHSLRDPYGRNGGYYNGVYANAWELGYGDYYPHYYNMGVQLNQKYQVEFSTIVGNAYLKVNNAIILTDSRNTTISDQSVYFFTNSLSLYEGSPCTEARLYSCKIWNANGVLVRDFIPVLDKNNIPCLWDKEEKFYYNAGTGQFLYG